MADQFNILDNPAPASGLLVVGEETISRRQVVSSTVATGTSGHLRVTGFRARKSQTVSQMKMITGGTAAAATPTLCRMGLYLVDEVARTAALVMSTPNDTTLFAATGTSYTKAASASYATVAGRLYLWGVLVVSAAAMPTFQGTAPAVNAAEAALADRIGGFSAGQSDLPASLNEATLTDSAQIFYGVLLP